LAFAGLFCSSAAAAAAATARSEPFNIIVPLNQRPQSPTLRAISRRSCWVSAIIWRSAMMRLCTQDLTGRPFRRRQREVTFCAPMRSPASIGPAQIMEDETTMVATVSATTTRMVAPGEYFPSGVDID